MDAPTDHVTVIGVGVEGRDALAPARVRAILAADLLAASERHHALFPDFAGERLAITSNVREVAEACGAALGKRRVVVLGTGDPNFFGIGRYLVSKLGAERVRILPAPSTMQEAFARVGLPWHEARFGSCHGRPVAGVVELVKGSAVVGLFTDPDNTPARIAAHLLEAGLTDLTAYACCDLGGPDERIFRGDLSALKGQADLPQPNLLILAHAAPPRRPLRLGLAEEAFVHRKPKVGLITKREIRAVAIAKLALTDASVVWDIGAGSGSVAIECGLICHRGRVFAVEKNAEDVDNIQANIAAFATHNVAAVHATAPEGLADLPDPDAVFVGGTGKQLDPLLSACLDRLSPGGRLVMTLATLDNLAAAMAFFKARELPVEVTQMQVARGAPILDMIRLEALNPVTLLAVERPAG